MTFWDTSPSNKTTTTRPAAEHGIGGVAKDTASVLGTIGNQIAGGNPSPKPNVQAPLSDQAASRKRHRAETARRKATLRRMGDSNQRKADARARTKKKGTKKRKASSRSTYK